MLEFDHVFLSKLNSTKKDWPELSDYKMNDLAEIKSWLLHKNEVHNNYHLEKSLKPGYRALFYGSNHSNKILFAKLLGKDYGLDVYKIDLSLVISKNIEETKKNLAIIFSISKHNDWILFFDKTDVLFSESKSIASSNYLNFNRQVDYFLKKIQSQKNLIILASTSINSNEDIFARYFNIMIPFLKNDV